MRLITKSKLSTAEQFEEWVFDTVLPTLLKTGTSTVGEEHMSPDDMVARSLVYLNMKYENLKTVADAQREMIEAATNYIGEIAPR